MEDDYIYDPDIAPKFDHISQFSDGCVYNKTHVICPKDTRAKGQCERCGWNPTVARRRVNQIRKELAKKNAGNPV